MAQFRMPSLGADMEEGTVLEWLVKPGDVVRKGDIVAVVDTAKAAVEVETFTEGVVEELLVDVGTKVPVGTPLARIGSGAEAGAAPAPASTPPLAAAAPGAPSTVQAPHAPETAPLVRRLAADLGVDLTGLTGSGLHGRITRQDVVRAAGPAEPFEPGEPGEPAAAEPVAQTVVPSVAPPVAQRFSDDRVPATPYARRLAAELGVDLDAVRQALDPQLTHGPVRAEDVRLAAGLQQPPTPAATPAARPDAEPARTSSGHTMDQDLMRETIARLMARSKREIPHYYLTQTVDMSRAREWMRERNRDLPVTRRLLPAALMLKATALAAGEHPELNGFWVDGGFVAGTGVHLGVAISLRGGGLVAPALHDADALPLEDLMAAMRDLVTRARAGRLRGSQMSDPTLTVTNLGDQGVESVLGVIYPPQVALVGFGRVVDRPWASDGMLGVRPVTHLTLAADHRATDGFVGARFLATIDQLLQTPEEL